MTMVAGRFSGQDLVPLDARHCGRQRSVMGDEEEAALSVADPVVFPLQPPAQPLFVRIRRLFMFLLCVSERVLDHNNRDLSTFRRCLSAVINP
jgi:hypothetical protein